MDIRKYDEEERKTLHDDHNKFKADANQRIFLIKDELDTLLSNPNMIAWDIYKTKYIFKILNV